MPASTIHTAAGKLRMASIMVGVSDTRVGAVGCAFLVMGVVFIGIKKNLPAGRLAGFEIVKSVFGYITHLVPAAFLPGYREYV